MESNLCHGSRRVNSNRLTLPIPSDMDNLQEPQLNDVPLDNPVNSAFVIHYSWILDQQQYLDNLGDTANRDLQGRRRVLREKMARELQRLDGIKSRSWESTVVELSMGSGGSDLDAVPVASGAPVPHSSLSGASSDYTFRERGH